MFGSIWCSARSGLACGRTWNFMMTPVVDVRARGGGVGAAADLRHALNIELGLHKTHRRFGL